MGTTPGTKPSRPSPSFSNPAAGLRISARLGGDEFAVILPQTGADGSAIVRQSILDLIEQTRLLWQGEVLHLSLSAGIATLSRETTAPEDLMAAADADMYRQKAARKDRKSTRLNSSHLGI